jgi:sigma-B regulation protein RsbU (phosphoserine phosphatase)
MFSTLAALRAQTQFRADVDVTLANVNRLLVDDIEPGRFVTFFYGVVDPAHGALRYACAGHNPPLKMGAGGAVEWLDEAGVPLGILPDARYRAATTPLAPDDILVLYSDGITEAEGPGTVVVDGIEEPDQFGSERLVEAVRAHRDRSAREIVEGIARAVRRFAADVAQSDDITLVVVKVTGPARPEAAPTGSTPR